MKHEFSRQIFAKYLSNFMKIHPAGAEAFLVDRRNTHTTKLISRKVHEYRGPFFWKYGGRYVRLWG